MPDLRPLLSRHRPEVLRHCYRMMGSYADAEDLTQDALLGAWEAQERWRGEGAFRTGILAIATHACLDALASRRRLELPQLEYPASMAGAALEQLESSRWLTPAPDARLFPDPEAAAERRESVALPFLAALQRLPALQRAALLLGDVARLPAEEIAAALELTVPSADGALHRAREAMAELPGASATLPEEPPPEALAAYARAWEARDLDGLTALLREDVTFAMPPYAVWFRGREAVAQLLRSPRVPAFWAAGVRVGLTRANGLPALGFFSGRESRQLHAIGVTRFDGGLVAELTVFIGPAFLAGFGLLGTTAQDPDPDPS